MRTLFTLVAAAALTAVGQSSQAQSIQVQRGQDGVQVGVAPAAQPTWHNGRWWYQQNGQWLYWSNNQWVVYQPVPAPPPTTYVPSNPYGYRYGYDNRYDYRYNNSYRGPYDTGYRGPYDPRYGGYGRSYPNSGAAQGAIIGGAIGGAIGGRDGAVIGGAIGAGAGAANDRNRGR